MKTVGIVGGIGPESTIDYYRLLISRFRERYRTNDYPKILINSINMNRMLELVARPNHDALVDYMADSVNSLASGGADFAALASNTPHVAFDQLRSRVRVPLISIVEETCQAAKKVGYRRVGLFGTRFTMQGNFYSQVFGRNGIEISIPSIEDQDYIHDKYMNELVKGIFPEDTKACLIDIGKRMRDVVRIDALILGGTELPLILKDGDIEGVILMNTTAIHVEALVDRMN